MQLGCSQRQMSVGGLVSRLCCRCQARLVLSSATMLHHQSSGVSRVASSSSTAAVDPKSDYELAVFTLNSLQSNASVLDEVRKRRKLYPDINLHDSVKFLERTGLKTNSLDKLRAIHVTGTKGKGSTCAFTESILRHRGYKTGFFSSPHLVHVRERIRINGEPLSETDFAQYFWKVFRKLQSADSKDLPSYFKFLTVMAYFVFVEEQVDVALVEVGIGGAYDCTNILQNPVVCGVTMLDYDHMAILGETLEEIAWNKAGIFKDGSFALTIPHPSTLLAVFRDRARERKCPLYVVPPLSEYRLPASGLESGIAGHQQYWNISLAIQLAHVWISRQTDEGIGFECVAEDELSVPVLPGFPLEKTDCESIRNCRWPGRSQLVRKDKILYFLDGAHTPKSIQCCAEWFRSESGRRGKARDDVCRVLVFHCTGNRSPSSFLPFLLECDFDDVLFCPPIADTELDPKSDQTNLMANRRSQLERCSECRLTWLKLAAQAELKRRTQQLMAESTVSEDGEVSVSKRVRVLPCIRDSLSVLNNMALQSPSVEVLVTGSLHLVGGVLGIIDPDMKS